MRRIPFLATLVVLLAVAAMLSLGVWQIHRLHEKEALIARYARAHSDSTEIDWPVRSEMAQDQLYRRARLTCVNASAHSSMAGRSRAGALGMAQTVRCPVPGGAAALVVLGWSARPNAATAWAGGEIHGVIAPGPRLVADPPVAGLQANAVPDPSEIPNNHLSYAVQWFLFAGTALVIYAIAIFRRARKS